ncbi:MAG: oligosaccharide flippase family protein [Bacteroidia bacterium]|nr:oligosaccharide flippase family protein [Bacteroidia bacterium]
MKRDALSYLAAILIHRGQPLLEALILTVFLSVEEFGRWSWATALYTGVATLSHGGIPAALLRYSALYVSEGESLLRKAFMWMGLWAAFGVFLLGAISMTVPTQVCVLVWAYIPALPAFLMAEVLRTYLRGRYENERLIHWQLWSTGSWMLLLVGLTWQWGIGGAAMVRVLQPLWLLFPVSRYFIRAGKAASREYPGFLQFGWRSLWGNWALEAIFFLPSWFLGWHSASPTLMALWRWATLLPLNLRALFAQGVIYFYPAWVRSVQAPHVLYQKQRLRLWGLAALIGIGLVLLGMGWTIFPGESYLSARPYYWVAIGVGFLWSTEALLLPNLLSARGHIHAYSLAYAGGLAVAILFYAVAKENLWIYLGGLAAAALTSALLSGWQIRRLSRAPLLS